MLVLGLAQSEQYISAPYSMLSVSDGGCLSRVYRPSSTGRHRGGRHSRSRETGVACWGDNSEGQSAPPKGLLA